MYGGVGGRGREVPSYPDQKAKQIWFGNARSEVSTPPIWKNYSLDDGRNKTKDANVYVPWLHVLLGTCA